MKKHFLVIGIFLLGAFQLVKANDFATLFEKATELQQQNHYTEALILYQEIEGNAIQSEALFYNIGNCYYQLQQWGYARAYYEKALKIDPTDTEALINLNLTLKQIESDAFQEVNPFANPVNVFTQHQWLFLLTGCVALFTLCFLAFRWFSKPRWKNVWLTLLLLFCLFSIFSLVGYFSYYFDEPEAIMVEDVNAHKNPIETSEALTILYTGQKVVVVEKIEGWTQVKQGENTFWVKSEGIVEL